MSKHVSWLAVACVLASLAVSCGPAIGSGGRIKVSDGANGPTFNWPACTEFGTKRCGEKLKLTGLLIQPLDCTVDGKQSGERPTLWQIGVTAFGASITPPIQYGVTPPNVETQVPPHKLTRGCEYVVVFTANDKGGAFKTYQEKFNW
jgi:hypothetical protein